MVPAQNEALDLHARVCEELAVTMLSGARRPAAPQQPRDLSCPGRPTRTPTAQGSDRLLLRLWLAMPNSRPLPEGFEVLWGAIEAGAPRGGVRPPVPTASSSGAVR